MAAESILIDDFENDLNRWEVQSFSGMTDYRIVPAAGGSKVLLASSSKSASGLVSKVKFKPAENPVLTWRWKISSILPDGDSRNRQGDDYPARIYVIFPHWLKPLSRTINYIWANRLPKGKIQPNIYFSRSIMVAVESGDSLVGKWVDERRNLFDDYRELFGEDPPAVGIIAIMTDTDNTEGKVQAWYDDIYLKAN